MAGKVIVESDILWKQNKNRCNLSFAALVAGILTQPMPRPLSGMENRLFYVGIAKAVQRIPGIWRLILPKSTDFDWVK
jgi:hypothetical protein